VKDKQPLRVMSSNAGHLLFSNGIPKEKAECVVVDGGPVTISIDFR
jgi:hypothetical protein